MTEKQRIEFAFREIVESEALSKSQHNQQLLEYLVKATLEERDIKEYTIANEVFSKDSDTGVRAYIHNLRKKLDEYYNYKGNQSEYVLTIPKGQYHVHVESREAGSQKLIDRMAIATLKKVILFLSLFLFLILIAITLFFYLQPSAFEGKTPNKTLVWKGILSDDKNPLLLVVGDHFFYGSNIPTNKNKMGITRDFYINSEEELNRWLNENKISSEDSIYKINYTYTTKECVTSAFKIGTYLKESVKVQLVFASKLTYEQIKNSNILYIGKYSTLGTLKPLVDNKYFHEKKGKLNFFQKDSIITRNIMIPDNYKVDYPVVVKFKTPYEKTIMMFVAGDDPGIAASLDYFMNIKDLSKFEKNLNLSEDQNAFSSLFKVKGHERTDYSIELISGRKIDNQ